MAGHATEWRRGNDIKLLPQTAGYPQMSRRHDLPDPGEDPLSALTDHRSDHTGTSTRLQKTEKNIKDQMKTGLMAS